LLDAIVASGHVAVKIAKVRRIIVVVQKADRKRPEQHQTKIDDDKQRGERQQPKNTPSNPGQNAGCFAAPLPHPQPPNQQNILLNEYHSFSLYYSSRGVIAT